MKKFKKFVCAVLVAAVSACAVPTYQADAASISQLQQKRQNLASSTKKAKQEIANIKNKKLSVEQEMEANELSDLLDGFLETLDKRSRIMFVRRYWYSDSISDLAERFQISNNNVSVRLSRIRGKLKRYLKKEGVEV